MDDGNPQILVLPTGNTDFPEDETSEKRDINPSSPPLTIWNYETVDAGCTELPTQVHDSCAMIVHSQLCCNDALSSLFPGCEAYLGQNNRNNLFKVKVMVR
jgi:hypothetical protein